MIFFINHAEELARGFALIEAVRTQSRTGMIDYDAPMAADDRQKFADEGAAAFRRGAFLEWCPYVGPGAAAWRLGWKMAKIESDKAKGD